MHFFIILGTLISLAFSFLYLIASIQGKVRPNKVTWLIWGLAPGISGIAAISSGVSWAVLPVFAASIGPLMIFFVALFNKNAYSKVERMDYVCGLLSIIALIAWYLTKDANIAIVLSIVADIFAGIPTLMKGYKYPDTENGYLYLGGLFSTLMIFTEIEQANFAELAFPIYLIVLNIVMCLTFELRRYYLKKSAELL